MDPLTTTILLYNKKGFFTEGLGNFVYKFPEKTTALYACKSFAKDRFQIKHKFSLF